jgi:hypothetical protein
MKKLLMTLLISLVLTGSSWAEWVLVGGFVNDTMFYYDPSTIRKDGNFRKVWELRDLIRQQIKGGELSVTSRKEYDCQKELFRTLFLSTHSNQMGTGSLLLSGNTSEDWNEIPPNSASELTLKIVCAK